jgi:molybdopterin/thiamine biosynthesis adenylyltransferase
VQDLTDADRAKYGRQLTIPGFGEAAQRRLKNSSALVARCGGLGGTVAYYLAAAGIGRLTLMHGGNLTRTNLNRQILMTEDWVGRPRAEKIRQSLQAFNPDVKLTVVPADPTDANIDDYAARVDVLCDCPPTFEERFVLNRASVRHKKPLIEAAMNGMEGQLTVIVPGMTPCLHCLWPGVPPDWCGASFPVLGAVSGALGCLAAIEAIKVLTGFGEPLVGELLVFDTERHDYRKIKVHRSPDCPVCGHLGRK